MLAKRSSTGRINIKSNTAYYLLKKQSGKKVALGFIINDTFVRSASYIYL